MDERLWVIVRAVAKGPLSRGDYGLYCVHCGQLYPEEAPIDGDVRHVEHGADCPVTLARTIMTEHGERWLAE